jgi:hypothetical protein
VHNILWEGAAPWGAERAEGGEAETVGRKGGAEMLRLAYERIHTLSLTLTHI